MKPKPQCKDRRAERSDCEPDELVIKFARSQLADLPAHAMGLMPVCACQPTEKQGEENPETTAADDHRHEDGHDRTPGVGFMCTRQTDRIKDETQQSGEETSANRDELKSI